MPAALYVDIVVCYHRYEVTGKRVCCIVDFYNIILLTNGRCTRGRCYFMPLPQVVQSANPQRGQYHTPPDESEALQEALWATICPTMSGTTRSSSWNSMAAMAVMISTKKRCTTIPTIAVYLFLESAVETSSQSQRHNHKVDNANEARDTAHI